jgi:hypothetical protein
MGDDVEILKKMNGKAVSYDIRILTPGVPQAAVARPAAGSIVPPPPARPNGHLPVPGPAPLAPVEPALAQETGEQRIGRRVKVCGRIALDAIAEWEAYGVKIGVPVKFESDDCRALAITLLIEIMRREGGR